MAFDVVRRHYQIALLELHELVDTHVFPYVIVVCEDAFAVHCALEYVSIVLNLTVTDGVTYLCRAFCSRCGEFVDGTCSTGHLE